MAFVVSIESLDGGGKTTLANALTKELPELILTKEPGSTWVSAAAEIRRLCLENRTLCPLEKELLFYADASAHRRFLETQSGMILSDRGKWSHLAYLRGHLKTKQLNYYQYSLCKKLIEEVCYEPDCVIYLDMDLDLMKERLAGKEKDAIESNDDSFFEFVLETYRDLVIDRERLRRPMLVLNAKETTCINSLNSVNYLKEVYQAYERVKRGDR